MVLVRAGQTIDIQPPEELRAYKLTNTSDTQAAEYSWIIGTLITSGNLQPGKDTTKMVKSKEKQTFTNKGPATLDLSPVHAIKSSNYEVEESMNYQEVSNSSIKTLKKLLSEEAVKGIVSRVSEAIGADDKISHPANAFDTATDIAATVPLITIVNESGNSDLTFAIFQALLEPADFSDTTVAWKVFSIQTNTSIEFDIPATYSVGLNYMLNGGRVKTINPVTFEGYSQDILVTVASTGALGITGSPRTQDGTIVTTIPPQAGPNLPIDIILSKGTPPIQITPPITSKVAPNTVNIRIKPKYYVAIVSKETRAGGTIKISSIGSQAELTPGQTATVTTVNGSSVWTVTGGST